MAVVLIPVIFRGPTHGEPRVVVETGTIGACFDAVEELHPGLRELVIDPKTRSIHRFVKVTLNGEVLETGPAVLETPVGESDEIEIIAAIAGG